MLCSGRPSFKDIALKHGTDKVTDHHYWYMYEKYLEPLRDKKVKMLEIGLGCDMSYGPGKSYYTWLEFFPNVDLYYIEYDAACAEKWKHKTDRATIFAGDQADRTFLRKFIEESGGNFDIIIDDGGHQMNQQLISQHHRNHKLDNDEIDQDQRHPCHHKLCPCRLRVAVELEEQHRGRRDRDNGCDGRAGEKTGGSVQSFQWGHSLPKFSRSLKFKLHCGLRGVRRVG
ncbi:hypothetical protein GE09DRAFT_588054 [Coniochaeta sp. 2T2.1]|nr:hypothetical protein GE09DRAFT_588054 [Coniochaeta sp. 2T2.1]